MDLGATAKFGDIVVGWLQSRRAEKLLRSLIVVASLFFVAIFLYAALRRMRYPYDLEWIESGIAVSIARLVHGQPLYAKPSLDYVPFLYAPLYFYVCAFVSKFTGVGFVAQRLVSTLSTLGSETLLAFFVWRETKNWLAGIASAGIFASLYFFIEGWVDIGRVDAFFIFLFLLALYCTRFAPPVVAALVWVLAFQTKQTMLPIAVPFLLTYWERRRPARVVVALASYAALAALSILWMDHLCGGWYKFYVFGTLKGLPGVMRLAALYPSEILLRPFSLVYFVIVAALILVPVNFTSRRTMFYLVGSAVLFLGFWYVRAHRGYGNTMQAIYIWSLVLFGMALDRLLRVLRDNESAAAPAWRQSLVNVVLLAALLQLGSQVYNPGQFIPSAEVRQDRAALEADLRAIPGDVYVVNHSWDAVLAGKQPRAEGEAVGAVVDAGGAYANEIVDQIHDATMHHKLKAIVIDGGFTDYHWLTAEELAEYPVHVPAPGHEHGRFLTSQPTWILLPCSSLTDGLAATLMPDHVAPVVPSCNATGHSL